MRAHIDAKTKSADQAEKNASASREAASASGLLKASQTNLHSARKMLSEIDGELASLRLAKEKYIKDICDVKVAFRDEILALASTIAACMEDIVLHEDEETSRDKG